MGPSGVTQSRRVLNVVGKGGQFWSVQASKPLVFAD